MTAGEGGRLTVFQNQYLAGQDHVAVVQARFQVWQALASLQNVVRAPILPKIL
jgi:ABC-type histidine transport system ATPase subunit